MTGSRLLIASPLVSLSLVAAFVAVLLPSPPLVDADTNVVGGPPERPTVFKNPEEMRDYLTALNDYFAIVGRPRSIYIYIYIYIYVYIYV